MASPPRDAPTKDDYVGSPSSVRNVSDAETLRALAQLDSGGERAQTTPQASRRRSTKDRTPRQVQAFISARKSHTDASAKKQFNNKPLKDQTPINLLRAMTRLGDMPPPTPDEVGQDDGRRDSMASGSGPKMLTELDEEPKDESAGDDDDSLSYASGSEAGSVVDHEPDRARQQHPDTAATPAPASPAHALSSSSTRIAGMLGLDSRTTQPLPPQPNFGTSTALASASRSDLPRAFDHDEHPRVDEELDPRRMSAASSWSVEKARRESRTTSVGGGSPGGPLSGNDSFFDRGSPGSAPGRLSGVSLDGGGIGDRSKTFLDSPERTGTYSDIDNLSTNLLVGADEVDDDLPRQPYGSAAGGDDHEHLASANLFGRRDSVRNLPYLNDDEDVDEHNRVGDDTADFGARGGAEEDGFDDVDRIPWAEKGKNVAVDLDEDLELDQGDDFDEAEVGQRYAGMGFSDDEAPVLKHKMPKPPTLANTAASRKKRVKKQRYTSTGDPVGELPKKLVKSLFLHYLGPNVKLEDGALEAVMDASHEYFAQMTQDAAAYAKHAGRKTRLHEADLVTMMYRQRVLTDKCGLQALGRQHGLDRELQGTIDAMGSDGKGVGKGRKGKRKAGDQLNGGQRNKPRKSEDAEPDVGSDDDADESDESEQDENEEGESASE